MVPISPSDAVSLYVCVYVGVYVCVGIRVWRIAE